MLYEVGWVGVEGWSHVTALLSFYRPRPLIVVARLLLLYALSFSLFGNDRLLFVALYVVAGMGGGGALLLGIHLRFFKKVVHVSIPEPLPGGET